MLNIGIRDQIRRWMFETALPFWAQHGLDRAEGGYVEQLALDGTDAGATYKRTRVTCRQIYVFSHAHVLGWADRSRCAEWGIKFLIERTWQGSDKGFARRLSRTGAIIDPRPDLYDQAFALFAFAWFYRAHGDAQSREWMHRTLDFIETHLRHPTGVGFWHEMPPTSWRLQNPHMHLAEACLAAFEATQENRFSAAALNLIRLFQDHLFNHETATLPEFFDDNWRPVKGDEGRLVEPGHMMEWAWILNSARKLVGAETAGEIRALVRFAEEHGVDRATGATFNSVRSDGMPLDRGSRTWPNTERLKAAVALYELDAADPTPVIDQAGGLLLNRYLARAPAGTWMDAFDGDGKDAVDFVPTTTLYHLFLAFAEVLRVTDANALSVVD